MAKFPAGNANPGIGIQALRNDMPHLAAELVQHLDECFPHRCISEKATLESAHRYAGARELIDKLLHLMEQQ